MKKYVLLLICLAVLTGCGEVANNRLENRLEEDGFTCTIDSWKNCVKDDDSKHYEIRFVDNAIKYRVDLGEDGFVKITLWAKENPTVVYHINDDIGSLTFMNFKKDDYSCEDNDHGDNALENCTKYIDTLNEHKNYLIKVLEDSKIDLDTFKLS